MDARADLAEAACGVLGYGSVSAYYRQRYDPGTGFVRLDRIEYPNAHGGVCYWGVVVMLPQDLREAEKYIEQRIPALREALAPHMTVTQVRPEQLRIPNVGELPCVFVNGTREED